MGRKSTGKRMRFDIFKRDHFTCQYCGAQPPDVVLVIDHITPVAAGGETVLENLITACEACNQGKTDKHLDEHAVRPDADLLYLETQQEIAELQRFQAAKRERDRVLAEIIEQLQDNWQDVSGLEWAPATGLVRQMLQRYEPWIVDQAMVDVAGKIASRYLSAYGKKWIAYMYAVARNIAAESEGE